jgi:hypothetical protein
MSWQYIQKSINQKGLHAEKKQPISWSSATLGAL